MINAIFTIDNGVSGGICFSFKGIEIQRRVENIPVFHQQGYQTSRDASITRIDTQKLHTKLDGFHRSSSLVIIERPYTSNKGVLATISSQRAFEATTIVIEQLGYIYAVIDSGLWQKKLFPQLRDRTIKRPKNYTKTIVRERLASMGYETETENDDALMMNFWAWENLDSITEVFSHENNYRKRVRFTP